MVCSGIETADVAKAWIIDHLTHLGWQKDRICDAFSKPFQTFFGPRQASVWLRFSKDGNCWWLTGGDFTSAGENVLEACFDSFPIGMSQHEICRTVEALVGTMERKIAGAYSVRLLGSIRRGQ